MHLIRKLRSLTKQGLYISLATVILILIIEIILRLGAFVWYNWSEYYLFYGFHGLVGKVGISPWWTFDGKYYKFPPNYILKGAAGQGSEKAKINSHGFRGPDFEIEKKDDIFRTVCMGGSSTFGFHNNDDDTYPFELEQLFKQQKLVNKKVEVVNAGFPYYNTGSIKSLLQNEILKLDPDLITIYSAYNDIDWPINISFIYKFNLWLQQHSMMYLVMKNLLNTDLIYYKIRFKLEKNISLKLDKNEFEREIELKVRRYRENLKNIIDICRNNNIILIFIKQPMTNNFLRSRRHFNSYEEEYKATLKDFKSDNFNSKTDLLILVHRRFIDEMQKLADQYNIQVVDNIKIVDNNRKRLASHVHLTKEANQKLAHQIKATIESIRLP